MNWQDLPAPGACSWMSDGLRQEAGRLAKEIEGLSRKRATADRRETEYLAACKQDRDGTDASAFLAAAVAALQAELPARDALTAYRLAVRRFSQLQCGEIQGRLLDLELRERSRLGVPDDVAVPISVLQNIPEWWRLRAALGTAESQAAHPWSGDPDGPGKIVVAQLEDLRRRLAGEADRLAHVQALRADEAARAAAVQVCADERQAKRDLMRDRVTALLGD